MKTVRSTLINAAVTTLLATHSFAQTTAAEYSAQADGLRSQLDTLAFNYDALTLELSIDDIATIADTMNNRMATQIYAGVLRGAAGALSSGAGNSLDQALALAGALNEGGYDVRIATTTLSEIEAAALIAASSQVPASPAAADIPAALTALDDLATLIGDTEILAPVRHFVTDGLPVADTPQLALDIASAANAPLPDGTALDAVLLAEAQDYYWVQARLFGMDDWQDLHIAYTPLTPIEAQGYLPSPIPEELLHIIRVNLYVEVRDGDGFDTVQLMERQEFPVANLGRTPIAISVVPDSVLSGGKMSDVSDTAFYFPLLGNGLAPDAEAFTMTGLTINALDIFASGGAADLLATIGGTAAGAANLIGGLGTTETEETIDISEATGLILEVTYYPPFDGDAVAFERYLVDRIGAENRALEQFHTDENARPLAGVWALNISTGAIGAAELLDLQIARLAEVASTDNPGLINAAEYATLTTFFNTAAQAGAGEAALVYQGAPFIMLSETNLTKDGARVYATDVMQTGLRALSSGAQTWHADTAAAFRAGVAQTLMESALMDGAAARDTVETRNGSWQVLSTMPDLVTITSVYDLDDLDISPAAKAAATRDLDRGMVLAMAVGETPAWWRIDPVTGATIGVDAQGFGAEAVEYLQIIDVIITSALGINGAVDCGADLCCQATNLGWTIIGFAIIGGVGEGAVALNWADDILAGSMGLSAGLGFGLTGVNPLSGLCN